MSCHDSNKVRNPQIKEILTLLWQIRFTVFQYNSRIVSPVSRVYVKYNARIVSPNNPSTTPPQF